jgi:hypothetical protein
MFFYFVFEMVESSIISMEGMGFEPMSCIHGFIQLILKKQLQTKIKAIFKERSMLNIKT